MATVYVVEDDDNIRELIVYTLQANEHNAVGFKAAPPFYKALAEAAPDVVLLDIMLPGEDGLQILSRLRQKAPFERLPVMMITAKDSEYDKVLGLDSGADDYLAKPFGMMELVSRVNALLRRTRPIPKDDTALTQGALTILPSRHQVKVAGRPVVLTLKEYELLHLLMRHPGLVFSRGQLLDKVWGYTYSAESRTVDVHIRSLRKKLGKPAAGHIQTVRGVGYKFSGEEL